MAVQQFCLRWNNHQPNFISVFSSLLNSESLVDVTLAAEGRHLQAHKVVLSACSSYFQSLFMVNPCQHPIVILKDVKFMDLKIMVDFMYYGEVNVSQEQLPHILKTAEMLKIKGLAEMPDSTSLTKSQNNSTEKTDLLTPGESNWSSDGQRLSSSPSSCPLSPGSRRKRLRKSSSGSGSASTERTSEDQPGDMTSSGNVTGVVTKTEPNSSFSSEGSVSHISTLKQHSSESEIIRNNSQESIEEERHTQQSAPTRTHVGLQMPQPEIQTVVQQPIENPILDLPDPSSSGTTCVQQTPVHQDKSNGAKRGRLLIRQPRIKKYSDSSQQSPEGDLPSPQYLSLPPIKIERQCSEPSPHLLSVPRTSTLVKQHSHPLLPSQIQQVQSIASSSSASSAPSSSYHSSVMSPISAITSFQQSESERPVSPLVVVNDPVGAETPNPLPTLRVRTEELRRAVSSPQAGSPRSSHCPAVRPGPALGCNFCWNTIDGHGRILRRKTKYHCPECQTNLCIVPCFQEFHERHANGADPSQLTSTIQRLFPKTSSI